MLNQAKGPPYRPARKSEGGKEKEGMRGRKIYESRARLYVRDVLLLLRAVPRGAARIDPVVSTPSV